MMRWIFLFTLAFTDVAQAQDLATSPIGTRVSRTATFAKKAFGLPPGDFELVSREIRRTVAMNAAGVTSGLGENVEEAEVFLLSTVAGRFDIAISLTTKLQYKPNWIHLNSFCNRKTSSFFSYTDGGQVAQPTTQDIECWLVGHFTFELVKTPTPAQQQFLNHTGVDGPAQRHALAVLSDRPQWPRGIRALPVQSGALEHPRSLRAGESEFVAARGRRQGSGQGPRAQPARQPGTGTVGGPEGRLGQSCRALHVAA